MFEKNMRFSYLLDCYTDVLDGHSAAIMKAYYEDDLSLSEIAEGEGISRQGVRHIIKKSEEQLDFLESALGLGARYSELARIAGELEALAGELSARDGMSEYSEKLESIAKRIISKA